MSDTDPTKAAIEAMKIAYHRAKLDTMNLAHPEHLEDVAMTAAFRAQNGIVRVVPIEATEEMVRRTNIFRDVRVSDITSAT